MKYTLISVIARAFVLATLVSVTTVVSACAGRSHATQNPVAQTAIYGNSGVLGMPTNFFGGPATYSTPQLAAISAIEAAGAVGEHFSAMRLLTVAFGADLARREIRSLTATYGDKRVRSFLRVSDVLGNRLFASSGAPKARVDGKQTGRELGRILVSFGQDVDGTFYTEYMLDHVYSNAAHIAAFRSVIARTGGSMSDLENYNKISNAAFRDMGLASGLGHVAVAHTPWTWTSGMKNVSSTSAAFAYPGTGTSSSTESVVQTVAVREGKRYVFSATVDPSQITKGQFDLGIANPDGTVSYASAFGGHGAKARFDTAPWTCPPGVNHVLLLMQVNRTTVGAGKEVIFSNPQLRETAE